MLSIFSDIAPKSAVAAVIAWAGANYFIIGPEVASRVARADFVPLCEAGFRDLAAMAGEDRAKALPRPSIDPAQEYAAAQVRRLQDNPFMQQLRGMGGGLGDLFGIDAAADHALNQMERGRQAARNAYDAALSRIREETATSLAKAGEVCGCAADAAIADTRTEWAIYSGTLTLIAPAPVKAFDEKMAQASRAGCEAAKAGA